MSSVGFHPAPISCMSRFLIGRTNSIRVERFPSQINSLNSGVPEDSVLAITLVLLFINDFLTSTSRPFTVSRMYQYSLLYFLLELSTNNIHHDRAVLSALPTSNLGRIAAWGSTNRVCFNPTMTSFLSVSLRHLPYHPQTRFNPTSVRSTESLTLLDLSMNAFLCRSRCTKCRISLK